MALVPHRFLFRIAHPCRYVKDVPREDDDRLLELPAECRIDNFAAMDGQRNFAEVSLAWNELGLAVQVEVRGKEKAPQGDAAYATTRNFTIGTLRRIVAEPFRVLLLGKACQHSRRPIQKSRGAAAMTNTEARKQP